VIENTLDQELENKTCESCGEEFTCGANAGKCWCFDVELKKEILAEMRENFENCLCANCLKSLADRTAT